MNNELLYNELDERTKDFGRTHFVKLLMEKEREKQELIDYSKEKIDKCKESIENLENLIEIEDISNIIKIYLHINVILKSEYEEILSKIEKSGK